MTEKENYLRLLSGEIPEWLPRYSLGPGPDPTVLPPSASVNPSITANKPLPNGNMIDIWGVEYTPTKETGGAALPVPGKFILEDITEWRDVIKAPSLEGIDWEAMAKKDTGHINRDEQAIELLTHVGYFQQLMSFMGFNEGLMAMYEEPEECMALFEYMADFYDEVTRKAVEYYKPDVLAITDDTATAINPFMSLDMYREVVKPYHARLGKIGMDNGLFINMHNCGRCEDFIDDWFDFGVSMWNPAQVMNDLDGIKKKYGRKLTLIGCWDSSGPPGWPGASEDVVRNAVRECIDRFAPDGGFCFWGSVYGAPDDEEFLRRSGWIADEYKHYGRSWYANH